MKTKLLRIVAAAAALVSGATLSAVLATPADAAVSVKVESQITAHNLPYLDSPYVASSTLAAGTSAPVECQAQGRESIGGSAVWYRVNHVYYPSYAFAGSPDKVPCGVAQTVPAAANGYSSPSFNSAPREGWFITGDNIKILCTAAGQSVNGSNAWFFARGYWLHSSRISQHPNGNGYATCWGYDNPNEVNAVIDAAESMLGKYPYSWGGGNENGPTNGICCSPSGIDDSHTYGFDCSGFTQYAFHEGAGLSIGGTSQTQYSNGYKVALGSRQAGDLIFWSSNGATSGIHHVALYAGGGQILEATRASSGPDIRKRSFSASEDGVMPYVVRPIH